MPFSSRASARQASSSLMRRRAAEREDEPDGADIEAVGGWVRANTACPVPGEFARRRRGLVLEYGTPDEREKDGEELSCDVLDWLGGQVGKGGASRWGSSRM